MIITILNIRLVAGERLLPLQHWISTKGGPLLLVLSLSKLFHRSSFLRPNISLVLIGCGLKNLTVKP